MVTSTAAPPSATSGSPSSNWVGSPVAKRLAKSSAPSYHSKVNGLPEGLPVIATLISPLSASQSAGVTSALNDTVGLFAKVRS